MSDLKKLKILKVTVLIENTSPAELVHEHGLSLHVEYDGHRYLLDAGATGIFTQNAEALGVNLAGVEKAALSHGHYDHADGLAAFCAVNQTAQIYARPAVTAPYYTPLPTGERKFIGVNPAIFAQYHARFDLADGMRALAPGLWLVPDGVVHEQSLVAETVGGLVVMNSCCHAGAGYLVRDILAQFPGQKVLALLGGFHLVGGTGMKSLGVAPGIVKNLGAWLGDELGVAQVYTGHCTGIPAYALLEETLGNRLHHLSTGDILSF